MSRYLALLLLLACRSHAAPEDPRVAALAHLNACGWRTGACSLCDEAHATVYPNWFNEDHRGLCQFPSPEAWEKK